MLPNKHWRVLHQNRRVCSFIGRLLRSRLGNIKPLRPVYAHLWRMSSKKRRLFDYVR
jgi:hypothetical protein